MGCATGASWFETREDALLTMRDSLQHRQAARFGSARKRLIQHRYLAVIERQFPRSGVVGGVFRGRGFWNRKHRRFPGQESESNLAWRRAMRVGNCLQRRARLAARRREIVVAERRIGDHRDAMLLAPWDDSVFDRALLQMIKHLIAGDLAFA